MLAELQQSLFREFKGIEKHKAHSKREILLVLDVSQHMMHGMQPATAF